MTRREPEGPTTALCALCEKVRDETIPLTTKIHGIIRACPACREKYIRPHHLKEAA